ncbi:MAG: tetratricopeptide repeat protein [Terriglobia bacterium]
MSASKSKVRSSLPPPSSRQAKNLPKALQHRHFLYAFFPILLFGLIAYWNSFSGEFLFDDMSAIVTNENIRHLWPPWDPIFKWGKGTRPVMGLSLAINFALGGLNTWSYHVVNFVIHLLNASLLFDLVRRTLLRLKPLSAHATFLSMMIATCWLVHPLNTESVTYITQRNESLMSLFLLLTLCCVVWGDSSSAKSLWYGLAVSFCALGMGTKQNMAAAPILVLLYDRTFLSGSFHKAFEIRWRLYGGLALTWAVLGTTFLNFHKIDTAGFNLKHAGPVEYALSQPPIIAHYLRLVFWPGDLCLDYYWPVVREPLVILPFLLLILVLLGATGWALKSAPALGFLGAFFFLILAPTSSLLPLDDLAAEHRMYLPSAPVILLAVIGVFAMARWIFGDNKPLILIALASWALVVVFALTWRTVVRNEDYRETLSMWLKISHQRPLNPRAPYNVGHYLYAHGQTTEAIDWYQKAIQIKPKWADAHKNLGIAFDALGKQDEAFQNFILAAQFDPSMADAHNNLGTILFQRGKYEEAREQFEWCIRLNPQHVEAHNNLGGLYLSQKNLEGALKEFSDAVRLKPEYADAQNNLGVTYLRLGQYDKAIPHLNASIRLDPSSANSHYSLGRALFFLGQEGQAEPQFTEALRLKPEFPEAIFFHAKSLERLNRDTEAIESYRSALRLKPQWPEPLLGLAWILATRSDLDHRAPADESLGLARQAFALLKTPSAENLDILAAAYAAAGRYPEAVKIAQTAAATALNTGNKELHDSIQTRVKCYQAGQPYREGERPSAKETLRK